MVIGLIHTCCASSAQCNLSFTFHCAQHLHTWHLVDLIMLYLSDLFEYQACVWQCLHYIENGRLISLRIGWDVKCLLSEISISVTLISSLSHCKAIIRQIKGWTPLTYHYHTLMSWNTWTYHNDMYALIWCLFVGWTSPNDMCVDSPSKG